MNGRMRRKIELVTGETEDQITEEGRRRKQLN